MAIISSKDQLNKIILKNPDIIPLINRFGIKLGVCDKTINTICAKNKLDTEFFITILNTFINADFFPEKTLKSFHANLIINYISKTYSSYSNFSIPNIERHFNLLITHSSNSNLDLIKSLFIELKNDISQLIRFDLDSWFPAFHDSNDSNITIVNSDILEDKINDLKNMFITHLSGDYEPNLCFAVISAIISLEKDIIQNNRIRNRILVPIYLQISK